MSIVVTGGGTGGHLTIAKSIGLELKKIGTEAIFIGSTYGQDRMWFENSDIFSQKYFLDSTGVVNKKGFSKLNSLLNIIKLSFKCAEILKNSDVEAVFSVGGYSASPACFYSIFFKKPLFIHEQNAEIGRLNKLFKPFSKGFYSSYINPKFDYPVNEIFFKYARNRENLKTIMFLGGSQGAKFINDLALDLAVFLKEKNISIIHQCGTKDFKRVSKFYSENNINADVFDFSNDLVLKLCKADLCVSRSGASSLWELTANRLPAIFIPFPYAANNHQFYNAKFLLDNELAKVINQQNASKELVLNEILNYDIKKISLNLENIIKDNGTKKILDDMFEKI